MPALRPLFAAAGVLLLIALVVLAVRSGDDTPVPSAGGTIAPGETATEGTGDPTDDATTGLASPDDAATSTEDDTSAGSDETACGIACGDADGGEAEGTGTEDTGTDSTGTDSTGTDSTGTDSTGTDSTGSGDSGGSTTEGTGAGSEGSTGTEGDGEDREVVAIGNTGSDVDDMPDTGGGAAGVLVGLVALGAGAGIARRR